MTTIDSWVNMTAAISTPAGVRDRVVHVIRSSGRSSSDGGHEGMRLYIPVCSHSLRLLRRNFLLNVESEEDRAEE